MYRMNEATLSVPAELAQRVSDVLCMHNVNGKQNSDYCSLFCLVLSLVSLNPGRITMN